MYRFTNAFINISHNLSPITHHLSSITHHLSPTYILNNSQICVRWYVPGYWHPIFDALYIVRRLLTIICILFGYTLQAQTGGNAVLTIKGRVTDAGTGEP